jgi:hypothetical protein
MPEDERKPAGALFSVSLAGAPFLAQREAVSRSMTVAATASLIKKLAFLNQWPRS